MIVEIAGSAYIGVSNNCKIVNDDDLASRTEVATLGLVLRAYIYIYIVII